ncbi:MAG TPA: proton-conducting transporter membrane subunit [Terriglobales bacterium]|nr:proton-conducting transporter membrane subunit [Terriglobales bacterium]
MSTLAPLPVVIPLSVAALLAALNKFLHRRISEALSILATIATGVVCGELLLQSQIQPVIHWFGGWTPRAGVALGISFVIDPIGAGAAVFTSLLVLAALVFSLHYFDTVGTLFHVLMLGFLGAMCGFTLTGDVFNLFVFFELMSASAFALCGYKVEEPESMQGALNFAITNTVGALLVLSGIGLLYGRTGALNMAQIGRTLGGRLDGLVITAFVFIMAGFFIKAAVFPFHFWLADAHAVAPTPVCVLFSGIMVELGIYAVLRVYWTIFDGPFAAHRWDLRALLLTVGTITAVIGAVMCFGQRHIKRLLAFSTVSHVGLLTIGFGVLKAGALAGVALYVVGHGLVKAALFLVAGLLLHRFSSVDELELHGRARNLRATGIVFFAAALGLASMPGFATFRGESGIIDAAGSIGQGWVRAIFFFSGVLTAGAVLRVWGRVFRGMGKGEEAETAGAKKIKEGRETTQPSYGIPAVMFAPAAALVLLAIAIGLAPGIKNAARTAASVMQGRAGYQARVLEHAWVPVVPAQEENTPMGKGLAWSFATTAAGLFLAFLSLSSYWPRKHMLTRPVAVAVRGLRSIHSGHVGDYVAFLTFGVAAFGVVLAALVHLH